MEPMKAIHIKPGRIIEYGGEMHVTPDIEREVEILQFVKSFWGVEAVCKIGNTFETINMKEMKPVELCDLGEPINFTTI